ncbi:MAG: hypothetical protein M1838_003049, partial [Thelocarpon superellum]
AADRIITSQLRHFVAQPYIHPPLLLPLSSTPPRKFHIRTYVVAVGSLRVYVYREMLALFATAPYRSPSFQAGHLSSHLTNTCLQDDGGAAGRNNVRRFWDLPTPPQLETDWTSGVYDQICHVTGETFEAAARGMMVHFQTLPNAFEVFGLDFLVDGAGTVWLLEVNAFPDFKQTGGELKSLVAGLFDGVVAVAIRPFFGLDERETEGRETEREEAEAAHDELRQARKADKAFQKAALDELVPRAAAGTHERRVEKKRDVNDKMRSFRDKSPTDEVPESDLLGGDDDGRQGFKVQKKEMERKKNERELRKEDFLRARAEEREERMREYRDKEDKTMALLKALARQHYG